MISAGLNIDAEVLLAPDARTANVTSTGVDISAYDGEVAFFAPSGGVTGGTVTITIKTSATGAGTYTAVTGGGFTAISSTATKEILRIDSGLLNKFVQASVVVTAANSIDYCVYMLGQKKY